MNKVTVKDARKLIAVMMVTYPNYKLVDVDATANAWADALKDYSYEQASMGLKAYVATDTNGFAPTPGQLIAKIQSVYEPKQLTEMEAWGLVRAAINNSGYYAEEEFSKLPPTVQKAVGAPGQLHQWALSDISYIESVAQSNFMRTYRNVCEREKEYSKLPADVRRVIEATSREMIGEEEKRIACGN